MSLGGGQFSARIELQNVNLGGTCLPRRAAITLRPPTRMHRILKALAAAEPEAPSNVQNSSSGGNIELIRPSRRPLPIYRAPPSPRTAAAKEAAAAVMAAERKERKDAQRSYGGGRDVGGGSFPIARPRYQGGNSGTGAPGNNAPGGQTFPGSQFQQRSQNRSFAPAGSSPFSAGSPMGGPNATANKDWKKKGKTKGGAAASSRKQDDRFKAINLTSRRKARQNRKQERLEEAKANVREREDIFEVGAEGMSVSDLAAMLAVPPVEIVKKLFMKGLMVQVNSTLDAETVKAVGLEYDVDVLDKDASKPEDFARKSVDYVDEDDLEFLVYRPPVVTVMGHVDHGKTSLLDFIRKSKVAAGEAGGITQAIGAYTCSVDYLDDQKQVTFLDTPGHEAFSAMRARGARVTDIAIIIVAADDGVRPQTVEAISHANAAGVPIVVAINKTDKEGANPERVKQELTEQGLLPEEWGGKIPMVPISAKTGAGVDALLETVLLVAELEELQSNPGRLARGTVLEATLDKQQGPMATVLVQAGTLRQGDIISAGASFGKVRMMRSTTGEVSAAGPSIAVQVLGLNAVPQAGDEIDAYENDSDARAAAERVEASRRLERLAELSGGGAMVTLSSLASMDESDNEDGVQQLQRMNIILKADASGSCEAVKSALSTLPQDTIKLRWLLSSPGEVTVSDVDLASASGGIVLGFNVNPSEAVMAAAKRGGVDVRSYKVIYDLVDDVKAAMEGKLNSVEERVPLGTALVKAVFGSGSRKAAGCVVTDGVLRKGSVIQVFRGRKTVVFEGTLTSLRRVKDDVKEVESGVECGVSLEKFKEWEEGDRIEAFDVIQKKLTLEEAKVATVEM